MEGIENDFFKSLRKANDSFGQQIRLAGLKENSKKLVEDIFTRKSVSYVKGKDALSFIKNIEEYKVNQPSMNKV